MTAMTTARKQSLDTTYIIPYTKSVKNVFATMMQLLVEVGSPSLKSADGPSSGVSATISLSGDVEGTLVLSFSIATAECVVSRLTGMQMAHDHKDFPDAVGELVSMVSGGAKAQFTGKHVSFSGSSVVIGSKHVVSGSKDVVCIVMPCQCDCGGFAIEVSIRQTP